MKPKLWAVAAFMLLAAAMLIADVGQPGVWFALVAIGVAFVVIERLRSHRP
jgi:hypothetical protein